MGRVAATALSIGVAVAMRAAAAVDAPAQGVAADVLRVGVPAGPAAVAGFDRDVLADAARDAGLAAVFAVSTAEGALADLDAGRLDLAAGPYPPGETKGRRGLAPVAADGDALLKRRGDGGLGRPEDAAGKVVGVFGPAADRARLLAGVASLHARPAPPARAFADPQRDLAAGRLAALAGPLAEVAAAALARPDAFEVVGPVFGRTVRVAPLMRSDRPDLADRLDAALSRMATDGRLATAQRRWFGMAFAPVAVQPVPTSKP